MVRHFRSKRAYRKFTAWVKMHHKSKRKRGHTVIVAGHRHRVRHRRRR